VSSVGGRRRRAQREDTYHANDGEDRDASAEHVTDEPVGHDLSIASAHKEFRTEMKIIEFLLSQRSFCWIQLGSFLLFA
jgi:hypothetical protein